MARPVERDAETAVAELRLFISLYDGAELRPDSRMARQLEAARRAIAAYDEAERDADEDAA
jgi:hypothetical protein